MPTPLCAQGGPVPVGARVRVTWMESTQSYGATGTVRRITPDTLEISTGRAPRIVTLGRGSISKFETRIGVPRGRSAALYGVLGAATWSGLNYVGDRRLPERKRVQQSLAWGAAGGVVGALLGSKLPRSRWRLVSP